MAKDKQLKKPKVLMIGPVPPPYSGPEISMELFLKSSLRERFSLLFLKTNFRKSNVRKGKLDLFMLLSFWVFFAKLIAILLFRRPRVAYYPVTPTAVGWLGRDALTLLLCRWLRVPSVIHLRGSHFRLNFQTFRPWVQRIIRYAVRDVRLALVQADYLHEEFTMLLPPERIKTLYQAIDCREFPIGNAADVEPDSVLVVGHLTQAKGYCDVLRAIPRVLEAVPGAKFYFAGNMRRGERGVFFNQYDGTPLCYEDPFETEAQFLSTTEPGHYFKLGIISGAQKLERFQRASVFLMPSYSEGFSRALLEALTLGKAVACTPVGAHREVIRDGEHALIFLPGEVEQMADAVIRLLRDGALRERMGRNNRRYAESAFSIEVIAQQLGDDFAAVMRR